MTEEPQDLVTGAEIARRMNISRERVRQLAQRPDFPSPIGRLGQSNVYGWDAVHDWLKADGRIPPIEIYSATDPPNVRERQVWYWVEWGDRKYERSTDYNIAHRLALELHEEHDAGIIDRSDRGSGILRATIDRGGY